MKHSSEENKNIIGLTRMIKITHSRKDKLQNLLRNTVITLENYAMNLSNAVSERDVEEISALIHKNTMTMFYIEADRLNSYIDRTRELLEREFPAAEIQSSMDKTIVEFEKVIKALEETNVEEILKKSGSSNR